MCSQVNAASAATVYIIWRLHVNVSPDLVQNHVGTVTFFITTPLYARFMISSVNHGPQHLLGIPHPDLRVGRRGDNDRIRQLVPTA